MVDTARFQLGPNAVSAVGAVVTAVGRDRPTTALEVATYVPLDVESVARILDSFLAEGMVDITTDEFKQIRLLDHETYATAATGVFTGAHLLQGGFVRNLVTLRGDPDWCRKVRDQHAILRTIASVGTPAELEAVATDSDVPTARVRAVLGDFETEGYARIEANGDKLWVEMPPLEYTPERFARNDELLSTVEMKAVPVHRFWWIALTVAAALLLLSVIARLVAQ